MENRAETFDETNIDNRKSGKCLIYGITRSTRDFMIGQKIQNGRSTLKIEFNIVSTVPSKEDMLSLHLNLFTLQTTLIILP